MALHPVFLSVVLVVRNQAPLLLQLLREAESHIAPMVSDYELIVVDNGSTDASLAVLKSLTGEDGQANLQVYALTKEVGIDTASWVGLENALGDFVAVIDPLQDHFAFISALLDRAVLGIDVVFAANELKASQGVMYRCAQAAFNAVCRLSSEIPPVKEAPQFRMLSKRVVNFMLQHPRPAVSYRFLPASAGFARELLTYRSKPRAAAQRRLADSIDQGMRLMFSTTRVPMRLVTLLSLFGAASNLLYSVYVVAIGLFKADVAPGWISLSLQQSGMFFLISLVLLVLGEYILSMVAVSNEGPMYHVAQEFTSSRVTRRERLNIEVVGLGAEAASADHIVP